jgi:hypothetical protein
MLEEFQNFIKILVPNAKRVRIVTKETNVNVKIEAKSNECKRKKGKSNTRVKIDNQK